MTVQIRIEWKKGPAELRRELTRLQFHVPRVLQRAIQWEMGEILQLSLQRVPKAFYNLHDSHFIRISGGTVEIGYSSPHAFAQHEGMQYSNFPNWENMREWAAMKLGDERLAFPVARQIFLRGLPHPGFDNRKFLENPIKERMPGLGGRLIRRVRGSI